MAAWIKMPLGMQLGLSPHDFVFDGDPRPTSMQSGILVHPAVWPQRTWAENWGLCSFRGGELGLHLTQCRLD